MTIVTHHGSSPRIESAMSAPPVSILSAIGSSSLPRSVTRLRLRAMAPSMPSVAIARMKSAAAAQRSAPSAPPSASSIQTNSGASRMRTTVMMFGRFQLLGVGAAGLRRSRRWSVGHRHRSTPCRSAPRRPRSSRPRPQDSPRSCARPGRRRTGRRSRRRASARARAVPCGRPAPGGSSPRSRASTAGSCSAVTSTSRAFEPSDGPDDLARLEEVHQAARLREADAELALQHRRRAELGRDDELGRREQQLEVVADVGVDLLLLGHGRDILPVLRPRLARDVRRRPSGSRASLTHAPCTRTAFDAPIGRNSPSPWPMSLSAPGWSRMTRESVTLVTANASRDGTLALMSPVTTSTDGRWVASTRWMPDARARAA